MLSSYCITQIDHVGRRVLLLWGVVLITVGMLILGVGFSAGFDSSVGLFVVAACIITAGYSLGFGPVCWILQSEMFPTAIRGRAVAISVVVSNLAQFLINFSFLPLQSKISEEGVFFFFFAIGIFGILFVLFFIVETKETEPAVILAELKRQRQDPCRLFRDYYTKFGNISYSSQS
jgi:MFS family permease